MSEQLEPSIAFCLLDYEGKQIAASKSDQVFYAASTIKLGVMIAVLKRVDSGELSLDTELISKHVFTSRIDGAGDFEFVPDEIDHGMPSVGSTISIRETVRRMIVVSSNEATNMLVEIVGFDAVNEAFDVLGTSSTKMTRMIGDYAAREAGFTHCTTAADLAKIMWAIESGQTASHASTELMLDFLSEQQFPVIADSLSEQCVWGSKSGWVDYIHHDVAFIKKPGCSTIYLAVCTGGIWVDQATESIRAVASQLEL